MPTPNSEREHRSAVDQITRVDLFGHFLSAFAYTAGVVFRFQSFSRSYFSIGTFLSKFPTKYGGFYTRET